MFYVQNGPKIVMLYCSISISTNEMAAFGVIQSCDILGHMVKCYVIGSIRYWTYYMISTHTKNTAILQLFYFNTSTRLLLKTDFITILQ